MMLRFCTTRTVPCGQEHNHKVKHWDALFAHMLCLPSAAQSKEDGTLSVSAFVWQNSKKPSDPQQNRLYNLLQDPQEETNPETPKDLCQRHMPETVRQGASFHPSPSVNPILSARSMCLVRPSVRSPIPQYIFSRGTVPH